MKRTLALLIAVLMVVALLPLSILTVGAAEESSAAAFTVYNAAGGQAGTYATLAEADAALMDGFTLVVGQSYTTAEPYAWGAARAELTDPINFTVKAEDGVVIEYTGTDAAWTFGANCAGGKITLENVEIKATAGAVAVVATDAAVVNIESGKFVANGPAVVRTMTGASASNPATLNIYGGEFVLNASAAVTANDAVVTNGTAGNVYVFGGVFVNNNDADNAGVTSAYTMKHTNAAGDFKIFGGVMMATGAQLGFFQPANTAATSGVAMPNATLPIVKGSTSKTYYEGREYYYTSYGAGELLLAPMVAPSARPVITDEGNALAFVTNVSAELAAALNTWARGEAFDPETSTIADYEIKFGTLITVEELYIALGGSLDRVLEAEACFDIIAGENDIVVNDDGSLEIVAVTPDIDTDEKEMRVIAISFIELTVDGGETQRWYGEFNMTTGVASMAVAAANALRDTADEAIDDYQYPSIVTAQTFSRYTEEEQQKLMEYLAHEHDFDYCGDCRDEECEENACVTLDEGVTELFYTEKGTVNFFELELVEGTRYTIGFTNDVVNYKLYDAEGNLCTVTNGSFTAETTGSYYLRVDGKKTGACEVAFSHVHNVDHLGACAVCEENIAIAMQIGTPAKTVVVKGNTYVFALHIDAGVTYTVRGVNGSITIYNAEGEAQVVTNNVFACTVDGDYTIVLQANYTGTATVTIDHIHAYDHTGYCAYCEEYLGVQLANVYTYSAAKRVEAGDKLYLNVRLEAGKTYKIVTASYIGSNALYNADGEKMDLVGGSTFECLEDGVYYLVVSAYAKANAQVRFELVHTECVYDNTGVCTIAHVAANGEIANVTCGKSIGARIEDEATKTLSMKAGATNYFFLDYAAKGVTYHITITGAVEYAFYKNATTTLNDYTATTEEDVTSVTYTPTADTTVYLVLTNAGEEPVSVSITIAHEHVIDHRGQCTVKNTTTGKTPTSCRVKDVTNLSVGTALTVVYEAEGFYRYAVSLTGGNEHTIALENAEATWELKDADGVTVYSSDDASAPFIPEKTATYYLLVTATADSTGTDDAPATLTITVHIHTYNKKGECNGENCPLTLNKLVLEADTEYNNYLAVGEHYFHVAMEAGNTYALGFFTEDGEVNTNVTFKLYSGENADGEMTLVDGLFECDEDATYYFVVTVTEDTTARDFFIVESFPTEIVE